MDIGKMKPIHEVGGIRAGAVYRPAAHGSATPHRFVTNVTIDETTFMPLTVTYCPVYASGKLGTERQCQWQTFVNWHGPEETNPKLLEQIEASRKKG